MSIEEQQTNGRAELKAVIMGIILALQRYVSNIKIKSDSKYVVNVANGHVYVWQKQNWILKTERTGAKHRDLLDEYLQLKENITVEIQYVKRGPEVGNKKLIRQQMMLWIILKLVPSVCLLVGHRAGQQYHAKEVG